MDGWPTGRTPAECHAAANALEAHAHEAHCTTDAELAAQRADQWRAEAHNLSTAQDHEDPSNRPVGADAARNEQRTDDEPQNLADHMPHYSKACVAALRARVAELETESAAAGGLASRLLFLLDRMETGHVDWIGPDGETVHPDWCRECRVETAEDRAERAERAEAKLAAVQDQVQRAMGMSDHVRRTLLKTLAADDSADTPTGEADRLEVPVDAPTLVAPADPGCSFDNGAHCPSGTPECDCPIVADAVAAQPSNDEPGGRR